MGHTNSTANLSLPQFIGTDKPTWLGDVNGAFSAIDSKVGTIDADIAATDAKADNAVADAASAVTTANGANNTAGNASTTATNALNIANNALTVANNADGHTNQLETKVGLLADLHTSDKTSIVNAINETFDALPSGGSVSVTADGVKTISQVLDELYALIDSTKISENSKMIIEHAASNSEYLDHVYVDPGANRYDFSGGNFAIIVGMSVRSSSSMAINYALSSSTYTSTGSNTSTSGDKYTIKY